MRAKFFLTTYEFLVAYPRVERKYVIVFLVLRMTNSKNPKSPTCFIFRRIERLEEIFWESASNYTTRIFIFVIIHLKFHNIQTWRNNTFLKRFKIDFAFTEFYFTSYVMSTFVPQQILWYKNLSFRSYLHVIVSFRNGNGGDFLRKPTHCSTYISGISRSKPPLKETFPAIFSS